ncbi:hypothetical protein [Algoriphagus sp. PAP.12]|uniref:hypothetical protein n=1 Tax=Algoriphagus sp. PAP.12 TaxID=2996678 RepID=UPI00227CF871|nr:hypothetical protein [Algoriphagus sp. PAP.12]
MKSLLQYSVLVLFVSALLQACSPVMYSNVGQNVPLFKEKGEVFLQGGISGSDGEESVSGGGFQFAYAISDHWQSNVSFYSLGDKTTSDPDEWRGSGSYLEIGGGYYGASLNKKWVYELSGGLGFSGIKNKVGGVKQDHTDVSHFKPYIQPSIGLSLKNFELAFTPRIAYNTFLKTNYEISEPSFLNEVQDFLAKRSDFLILEPGFTLRGGFENIKFQTQLVLASFGQENSQFINDVFFSLGLAFLIPSQKD